MLTNKDIVKSLTNVGYTLEEISKWTKIELQTLKNIKKNDQLSEEEETELNQFFRMNIEEVEAKFLENEEYRQTHLILTPTGFKKCKDYKDSGSLNCIKINFNNFSTVVVPEHKFLLTNEKWVTAKKIKVGDKIKVFDSEAEIISKEDINNIDCCEININNSYYLDGVASK